MRCVLCDDHPIVLIAQTMALESRGHEVLGTASTPGGLPDLVAEHDPDVCLTDLFFGEADRGDATLDVIGQVSKRSDVIVVTGSATVEAVAAATAAGAVAVVSKAASNETIMALVEGRAGSVEVTAHRRVASSGQQRFLTERELEVLQCLADGLTTERIASRLTMRHATARSHVQSVLLKLGVHTRSAAVAEGIRSGLIVADIRDGGRAPNGRLAHPATRHHLGSLSRSRRAVR